MNEKQWYTWAFFLIVASVTLKTVPLALMNYYGVLTYPDMGMIIGHLCGLAGVACGICGLLEKGVN